MTVHKRHRFQRRALIGVALVGIAAITGGIVANWPELKARWLLRELRATPTLLEAKLLSDDPANLRAAELFLRERTGRDELLRLYLDEFEKTSVPQMGIAKFLPRRKSQGARSGHVGLSSVGQLIRDDGGLGSSMGLKPANPERRRAILSRLDALGVEIYRHDGFAGFEFTLRRIEGREVETPGWKITPAKGINAVAGAPKRPRPRRGKKIRVPGSAGLEHICFFRVVD